MNLIEACELIKADQRAALGGEQRDPFLETKMYEAYEDFNKILVLEDRLEILEKCILDDRNMELHLYGRFLLLYKAKALGVSSRAFLLDYYGFLAGHIDEGEIHEDALKNIEYLLKEKES